MIPLNESFPRTLDHLPRQARTVWLFEDRTARLRAGRGGTVRVRSAYKTLFHDVVEDGLLAGARWATIRYPVVEGCPEDRFRLECYPLHALFGGCEIAFVPRLHRGDGLPEYGVETDTGNHAVQVPVRWRRGAHGRPVLAACGWITGPDGTGRPLATEYEAIFDRACAAMRALPLVPLDRKHPDGPFFDRLDICATIPARDAPLPVGHECISLAEALHEDIYFAGLEIFRDRLGLSAGDRAVAPGQLVPRVRIGTSPALSVRRADGGPTGEEDATPPFRPTLDTATEALSPAAVVGHLDALGGARYAARSRQDRAVPGVQVAGNGPARLAISAGQHGNESSGIVGALRAARDLAAQGRIGFTLDALENPDGYALFRELCRERPRDMHHAARYTASGADLEHCGDRHEGAIRRLAHGRLPAKVHVNLHGYPAHEWTRPLSGYVPHGFGRWTIPKGFFVILRHDPAEADLARRVLDAALDALAGHPELVARNRRMLALYERYAPHGAFEVHEGAIPFATAVVPGMLYPVTLITEAPDETIRGEAFRIAHEAQYRTVLAVAQALDTPAIRS